MKHLVKIGTAIALLLVGAMIAPYAVNHFWANLNLRPKIEPEVKLKNLNRMCAVAEMMKGGKETLAMVHVLAVLENRRKEVGELYDPERDFKWYVLYHMPGEEYEGGKTRECWFVYTVQGKTGWWMRSRRVKAETLFDRHSRGESVLDMVKYPYLKDLKRFRPYVGEGQFWETPGDPKRLDREMVLTKTVDGSYFYSFKTSR
jgi:hypothetical protein